jgi:hypothetical protein
MSAVTTALPNPGQAGTIDELHRLIGDLPEQRVTLGTVVDAFGTAGGGLCLSLFRQAAMIPGIAPVFGLALCTLAFGMLLGRAVPTLPERLRRWRLDRDRMQAGVQRLAPSIAWLERWLHPRAAPLLRTPDVRLVSLASVSNGILIVLPIPFGNTAPARAMLILSLGMVAGDGLAVIVGLLATIVALVVDIGMISLGYAALSTMIENLF